MFFQVRHQLTTDESLNYFGHKRQVGYWPVVLDIGWISVSLLQTWYHNSVKLTLVINYQLPRYAAW